MIWTRRRLAVPGREPDELPTLSKRALEGEGFAVIERREPSLLADGSVVTAARYRAFARPDMDVLQALGLIYSQGPATPYSALCAECLVVALAGCSLSVTANVRAESCRLLVLMGDIAIAVAPGVRASESTCGHRTP